MSDSFDIVVPIRDELKKSLIFELKARPPIALILGFSNLRHQVMPLMQTISHSTWAYITNANGLPGFVISFDIMKHLKEADEAGELEHARKW